MGVLGVLSLGNPATFNDGTNDWYVWDDDRITRNDLSWIGALSTNIANGTIPTTWHAPFNWALQMDLDELRTEARNFLSASRTAPVELTGEEANPWQDVLDLNSAPAVVRAAESVPDSWTAVE